MREDKKSSVGARLQKKKDKLKKTKINQKDKEDNKNTITEKLPNEKTVQYKEEKQPQKKKQELPVDSESESGSESDHQVLFLLHFFFVLYHSKFVCSPVIDIGETQNL